MNVSKSLFLTLLLSFVTIGSLHGQTWFNPNGGPNSMAGFTQALAIDGERIIATRTGASILYPSPTSQQGGVFIFRRSGTEWIVDQSLIPESLTLDDRFGQDVAVTSNYLAVSAPNAEDGCGLIYVFHRSDARSQWKEHAMLNHPACADGGRLGWSLSFSQGRLIAGAPGSDNTEGHVVSYSVNDNGNWDVVQLIMNPEKGTLFGEAVAAYPTGLLVGAPGANNNVGAAYAFSNGSEKPDQKLTYSTRDGHLFGAEIAVKGDIALISAPGARVRERASSRPQPGVVQAFNLQDQEWKKGDDIELPLERGEAKSKANGFGSSLAFTDSQVWIGAPYAGSLGGSVYVYDIGDEDWALSQILTTRPLAPQATFGAQVAVSETIGVAGAIRADFGEGRGIVFIHDGSSWQEETLIADNGRGLEAITGEETQCIEGEAGPFSCEGVNLLAFIPKEALGAERGVIVNDVWGWTDPETDKEYAILGRSNGTSFVDVSDPSNPVYLGNLPATEGSTPNHWRDVKVYKNHAYVVADGVGKHGMQVFDLTELRSVDNPPALFEETALYDPVYSVHNVVINEDTGFAYLVAASAGGETCGGGYHMVDINSPAEPTFAGCFSDPSSGAGGNHIHDAQCVVYDGPDEDYIGQEICFGANASVFSIADVTDKKNPKTISALDYPNVAYVHQGWLTKDGKYFYINDEGDEVSGLVEATRTLIWDVTDLDDPIYLKAYLGTTQASDHNFYVKDDLMYQSNYAAGLQIIDVSDPVNPKEVAHFDTVPWGDNAPGFSGSWSNYPYFKSGTILVSSITEGLFIVKKQPQQLP